MNQKFRRVAVAASLVFLVAAPSVRGAGRPPRFERVALAPVVVEPEPFENAPRRPDQTQVVERLSQEATKQAERILVRAHVAGTVERLAGEGAAAESPVLVTETLRLPVSLPPNVRGWDAGRRKGRFARVTLTARDARTGAVLATAEGACGWDDAFWTSGGPHNRRNRPLDAVLEHFARKTTERALWNLAHGLSEKGKMP